MGIRFYCPNGHKLHVKAFQAGLRGICPYCGTPVDIPLQSTRPSSKEERLARKRQGARPGSHDKPVPILQKKVAATSAEGPQALGGPARTGSTPPSAAAATSPPAAATGPGAPSMRQQAKPQSRAMEATIPRHAALAAEPWGEPFAQEQSAARLFGAGGAATAQPPAPPLVTRTTHDLTILDEAPNAVWYVRPSTGGQYGPATRDVLRTWLAEGRIAHDTLVWREGWRDWREAGEVFPQLAPSPEDPVPGLRSIIEEEVYALGPMATSPGQVAEGAQGHGNTTLVMLLLAGLVVLATAIIGLWLWLDTGS